MRLRWTPVAADDFEVIADYLAKHFPSFMQATIRTIWSLLRVCARCLIGVELVERREHERLVIARLPYIAVYRIKGDAIEILHIFHGAHKRP
jgi:plasmid stabilization system protein ParE